MGEATTKAAGPSAEALLPRRRGPRRAAVALVAVALAVPLGVWGWGAWEAQGLARRIDALRRAGEPATVQDLAAPLNLPDDQNPAVAFRAAGDAIDYKSPAWAAYEELLEFPPPLYEKERAILRAAVAENAKPLSLAQEAAARVTEDGRADWGVTLGSPAAASTADLLPLVLAQRRLAALLMADGVLAVDEGDLPRALRRGNQMAAQARAVDRHPIPFASWAALTMSTADGSMAVAVARALAASGAKPSDDLRRQGLELIPRLLDDRAQRRGMVDLLRKERVTQLDTITAAAQGRLPHMLVGEKHERTIRTAGRSRGWAMRNASAVLDEFAFVIDAAGQTNDLPALEAQLAARPNEIEASPRWYALGRLMTPPRAMPEHHYEAIAYRRMAAALLAVALYKADHGGGLPRTLVELVPEYLPAVPIDPMTAGGKPIGYVPDLKRPYVYNAGENRRDDGGRRKDRTVPWSIEKDRIDDVLDLVSDPRREPEDEAAAGESESESGATNDDASE